MKPQTLCSQQWVGHMKASITIAYQSSYLLNSYQYVKMSTGSNLSMIELVCLNVDCSFPFGPGCCGCGVVNSSIRANRGSSVEHVHGAYNRRSASTSEDRMEEISALRRSCTSNNLHQLIPRTKEIRLPKRPSLKSSISDPSDGVNQITIHSNEPFSSMTAPVSARFDLWLDELFAQTLNAQLKEETFVGGAEDQNPRNPCPICFQPQGDETNQHFLRCKYAHEERRRMEQSIWRGIERRKNKNNTCYPRGRWGRRIEAEIPSSLSWARAMLECATWKEMQCWTRHILSINWILI